MSSVESGKHVGQRRLVSETEPGQMARWDAHAARLGMTWAALVRALLEESVSMPEVIVYGIRAVGTEEIRFVGSTVLPLERRRKEGYPGKLGEWLAGVQWEHVELERTVVSRAGEAEARWVAELGGHGLLFNAGAASSAARGEVRFPVGLSPMTHAKAVELATRGHWSLGAFVQIAVERLIDAMSDAPSVSPGFVPIKDPTTGDRIYKRNNSSDQVAAEKSHDARLAMQGQRPRLRRVGPVGSASNPNSAFAHDDEENAELA